VVGSLEAGEHGGLAHWRAGLMKEDRSSFENNGSKNPTSSRIDEAQHGAVQWRGRAVGEEADGGVGERVDMRLWVE
jgi:hypothetical protein